MSTLFRASFKGHNFKEQPQKAHHDYDASLYRILQQVPSKMDKM